jgi:hypothetical protein
MRLVAALGGYALLRRGEVLDAERQLGADFGEPATAAVLRRALSGRIAWRLHTGCA